MFEKCIKCARIGESCVPNLMLLPFADLMQWWDKRQKHLGWTNQTLADRSQVPVGTIKRIRSGDYTDCKYSTIKSILITLIGGTTDEFSCTEQVERELQQMEQLEHSIEKISALEKENNALRDRLEQIDAQHRQDVRIIIAEYKEDIAFLKEQLRAWQTRK